MSRKQILFRLEPEQSNLFEEKLKEMDIAKQDFFSFIVDAFLRDEIEIDLSSQSLSQQANFSELQLTNAVMKISENPQLLMVIATALKPYIVRDNHLDNSSDNLEDNKIEEINDNWQDSNSDSVDDVSNGNNETLIEPLIDLAVDNNSDSISSNS